MPSVTLDADDAAELAEMLSFLSGWLARDGEHFLTGDHDERRPHDH